jgi:hypothetical protein
MRRALPILPGQRTSQNRPGLSVEWLLKGFSRGHVFRDLAAGTTGGRPGLDRCSPQRSHCCAAAGRLPPVSKGGPATEALGYPSDYRVVEGRIAFLQRMSADLCEYFVINTTKGCIYQRFCKTNPRSDYFTMTYVFGPFQIAGPSPACDRRRRRA